MANIPSSQVMPLFTTAVMKAYDERAKLKVGNFLRSFFPTVTSPLRYPAYEVRRATEKVAIPVSRGSMGNANQTTKSSLKSVDPFYYFETFDVTELEAYQRLFGSESWNINQAATVANATADELNELRKKIERAIEIQCSQIFKTGRIKSLIDSTVEVDFGRRAEMLVDAGAGNYWDDVAGDPYATFIRGGERLRQYGKVQSQTFNAIVGSLAIGALLESDQFQNRQRWNGTRLDDIMPPAQAGTLGTYHGTISAGDFRIKIWSYGEGYEDPNTGVFTKFIGEKQVVMLDENPDFMTLFGALPQLVAKGSNTFNLMQTDYNIKTKTDEWAASQLFGIESAPMPVPVSVDKIYTEDVLPA